MNACDATGLSEGIYEMSNEEYHASAPLSKSSLSQILKSPAHYKASLDKEFAETAAMRLGTAFHCAVLEPDRFKEEYRIPPSVDRRTKKGKEEYAEWAKQGYSEISNSDYEKVKKMRESVMSHKTLSPLFNSGNAELSVFHDYDYYGRNIWLKCRPDWFNKKKKVIVDLKSTMDASPQGFSKSCAKYGYALQAWMYSMICEKVTGQPITAFVFAAVESSPPYGVAGYILDQKSLELGQAKFYSAIDTYLKCIDTDNWPSYGDRIEELTLPQWAFYEE